MPVAPIIVSILILLEVILEEFNDELAIAPTICFNPYFTGSNSGSHLVVLICYLMQRFNPYFTGSNSGRYTTGQIEVVLDCFNPYFTGSNSGSINGTYSLINVIWFQSLFYWK